MRKKAISRMQEKREQYTAGNAPITAPFEDDGRRYVGCIMGRAGSRSTQHVTPAYLTFSGWSQDRKDAMLMDTQQMVMFKARGGSRVWVQEYTPIGDFSTVGEDMMYRARLTVQIARGK